MLKRQVGEDEIEITPEMIEAGAAVLREEITDLASGHLTPSEVSTRVHRAMELARVLSPV